VTGKVSSVSGSTVIEQQFSQATGTTTARTVTLTSSTTYTKIVKGTSTELAVGLCTTALGTADSTGAITARTISVRPVGANGCSAGFGQGGFRGTGGGTNG
jgi:hypothetical protein